MDFNKEFVLIGGRGLTKQSQDSEYKSFLHPSDEPVDYFSQENREWFARHRSSEDYALWIKKQNMGEF